MWLAWIIFQLCCANMQNITCLCQLFKAIYQTLMFGFYRKKYIRVENSCFHNHITRALSIHITAQHDKFDIINNKFLPPPDIPHKDK